MRVSTDKWARVSWLLCCVPVPPLSGIFGIDSPKKKWEAQFCRPELVGCYMLCPSSLWDLWDWSQSFFHSITNIPKWSEAQFCPPGLDGCYVKVVSILSLWDLWNWLSQTDGKHKFAGQSWFAVMLCPNYDIQIYGSMDDTSPNIQKFWLLWCVLPLSRSSHNSLSPITVAGIRCLSLITTPPLLPPSHWFCALLTFCTPIIFIGDKFSLGLKSLIPDYIS